MLLFLLWTSVVDRVRRSVSSLKRALSWVILVGASSCVMDGRTRATLVDFAVPLACDIAERFSGEKFVGVLCPDAARLLENLIAARPSDGSVSKSNDDRLCENGLVPLSRRGGDPREMVCAEYADELRKAFAAESR